MKCHFSFMSVPRIKHCGKNASLKKKGFIQLTIQNYSPSSGEIKAGPFTFRIKSRKRISAYMLTPQLTFFYSTIKQLNSRNVIPTVLGLPTSLVNIIETLSHSTSTLRLLSS